MTNKYAKAVGEYLIGLSARLEQGKPVQAPAAPPPQSNYQAHPFELFIPFATEEYARTFIHLLEIAPELPEESRKMIAVWLAEYDEQVLAWLHLHYGPGVDAVSDVITKQVLMAQRMRADQEYKQAVDTEISDLETQFEDGDNEQPA